MHVNNKVVSPEVFKSPHLSFSDPLTYGECDHGFIRVRGELHPIHNGPDGIERVVGHLRGLHFPSLPTALGLGRIKTAIHTDVMNAISVNSFPIEAFGIDGAFSVDSIPIHLNQVRLVIHPGTDKIDGQYMLEQGGKGRTFPVKESTFTQYCILTIGWSLPGDSSHVPTISSDFLRISFSVNH